MDNKLTSAGRVLLVAALFLACTVPTASASASTEESSELCGSTYGSDVETATWMWYRTTASTGTLDIWGHTHNTGNYAGTLLILTGEVVQCLTQLR